MAVVVTPETRSLRKYPAMTDRQLSLPHGTKQKIKYSVLSRHLLGESPHPKCRVSLQRSFVVIDDTEHSLGLTINI